MKVKQRKWGIATLIISALSLLVLFIFTDPREVGLVGILAVVLAIYTFFASCFYLTLTAFRGNHKGRRQLLIACVLAFTPVLLVIFNSLGAVGIIEIIAILLFEMITIFLITKRT